ncbi:hypothetical protein H634G_09165 [Metarhizium anisopliae BRIP 53293]|uniref:Uncharacterized protein n=1 Tax=Metarhizium anisopliae BRIP 53293 TaxID=1291518 RepID=A0A0D9NPI1_METAN|nr:hypothetical protein H634G_09165 [Metarhizium anisopliae BRIP 53293]KJK91319.1 hypothetical protein H633G_04869 [Metarhizium anisopliae BRIP 53284]
MSMLRVGVSCNVTPATAPDSNYSHRFIVAFVKVDLVDDGQAMLELRLDDDATLYRDRMARPRPAVFWPAVKVLGFISSPNLVACTAAAPPPHTTIASGSGGHAPNTTPQPKHEYDHDRRVVGRN